MKALRLSPPALRAAAMARALRRLRCVRSAADGNGSLSRLAPSSSTRVWAIGASERDRRGRQGSTGRAKRLKPFPACPTCCCTPDGPTVRSLVETLSSRPDWRASFVKAAAQLPTAYDGNVERLAFRFERRHAPLSIEEAQPLLDRLIEHEARRQRAAPLDWKLPTACSNGNFEQVSDRAGADVPRAWDISDEVSRPLQSRRPTSGAMVAP